MYFKSIDTRIFTILINLILVFPSIATNFNCSLECSEQDIVAIRNTVISTSHPFLIDNSSLNGKVITVITHPARFFSELKPIPAEFNGVTGKLPKGLIDLLTIYKDFYFRSICPDVNNTIKSTEFIFTGYGEGGKISTVLAALWAKKYENLVGSRPAPNQVKVITFSASAFGDSEFNRSLSHLLGQRNIIDFSSYFTHSTLSGVPVSILPDEQLFSELSLLKTVSLTSFVKTGIALGVLCYSYYLFKDITNTSNDFINTSGRLVRESTSISDEKYVSYIDSFDRFTSNHNNLKYLIFGYQVYNILRSVYNTYSQHYFVPSESVLRESFRYTQSNYHISAEASLDAIGKPPLISMRRGLGKMLKYLIGI